MSVWDDGFMKPVSAEVLPKLPSGTARPTKPVFIAELEREVVGAAGFGWPSWTILTTGGVFGPVTDGVIVPVEIGVACLCSMTTGEPGLEVEAATLFWPSWARDPLLELVGVSGGAVSSSSVGVVGLESATLCVFGSGAEFLRVESVGFLLVLSSEGWD